jgi:hypothetical protein
VEAFAWPQLPRELQEHVARRLGVRELAALARTSGKGQRVVEAAARWLAEAVEGEAAEEWHAEGGSWVWTVRVVRAARAAGGAGRVLALGFRTAAWVGPRAGGFEVDGLVAVTLDDEEALVEHEAEGRLLDGQTVLQLACGGVPEEEAIHQAAVTASGQLFTQGNNGQGQLGQGTRDDVLAVPRRVGGALAEQRVLSVSLGDSHSAAVTASGMLLTFGRGGAGRLGHGTEDDELEPRQVQRLNGFSIVGVSAGATFTRLGRGMALSTCLEVENMG